MASIAAWTSAWCKAFNESTGSSCARANPLGPAAELEAAGELGDPRTATTGVLAVESGLPFGCLDALGAAAFLGVIIGIHKGQELVRGSCIG